MTPEAVSEEEAILVELVRRYLDSDEPANQLA